AKKRPFYHLVVTDSRNRRDGRYIERLGFFNPVAKGQEEQLRIDVERVDYWISRGAQPSDRVASLLKASRKGIAPGRGERRPKKAVKASESASPEAADASGAKAEEPADAADVTPAEAADASDAKPMEAADGDEAESQDAAEQAKADDAGEASDEKPEEAAGTDETLEEDAAADSEKK
ncbi:MAG: 30S ribosomal protein S16, partial [Woeseia sp.]